MQVQDKLQLLQRLKAERLLKETEIKSRIDSSGYEAVQKYTKSMQTLGSAGISYDKNVQTFAETFENQAQTDDLSPNINHDLINDAKVPEAQAVAIKAFDQMEFNQFLQEKYELVCQVLNQDFTVNNDEEADVQTWTVSKDKWLTDLCVNGDTIVASFECYQGDEHGGVILWRKGDSTVRRILKSESCVKRVCVAPFNTSLIIGGTQCGQILVWDTKLQSQFPTIKTPTFGLIGHSAPICSLQIIGTAQASHIISASNDGVVCSWQLNMLAHPVELLEISHPQDTKWDHISISSMCFPAHSSSTFWIGTLAGHIYQINRFDRAGCKSGLDISKVYKGHTSLITGMNFNSFMDFKDLMLTSSFDWTVMLWKVKSTTELSSVVSEIEPLAIFDGFEDSVLDVAWSSTHPGVFGCIDASGILSIYNLNQNITDPIHIQNITADSSALPTRLFWDPSGSFIYVATSDGQIHACAIAELHSQGQPEDFQKFQKTVNNKMESISTNLPELPNVSLNQEPQLAKLMTDLERLNAQNSALTREKQSLEREKMAIQKELKKSNDIIQRSKEKNCIQLLLEENVRLRDEADTLYGEKVQNDALKTQIYALSMKQDLKALSSSEALSPIKNSSDLTAEIQILKAENQAAQDLLKQMRSDRDKLETQLRNQLVDLQDVKLQLESEQKKGMTDSTATGRFWWGKGASNQPAVVDSSTSSLAQPSKDNNTNINVTGPTEAPPASTPVVASVQAAASSSGVRSWWGGKSAAPAVNSSQPKTEASVPTAVPAVNSNLATLADSNAQQFSNLQNEISSIKEERKKLQSDLDTISKQQRDQKEMYESQIQNEKKKTVEAEQKFQAACSAADNLKETILILEDRLSKANDQAQAQKQDLEIKLKHLMETNHNSMEEDSKQNEISSIKEERKKLQSDLDTISKQQRDQKEMYESQIQNEKKKTVEAEQKFQAACSAADNLKETILILEDRLSKANDQAQAQKQDLEIKLKHLMETNHNTMEEDSKKYNDLHALQQKHELDIQELKESQAKELQAQEKILLDKIIVLQESLRLASSSDSDLMKNIEAKYENIIQEKDNQIKLSIQENQIKHEALIKKHEEELQAARQGYENQDKRIVSEHQVQIDKLNQIQKELSERIGEKDAEILGMNQKFQMEKQKMQVDFDEKLKQCASSTEEKIRLEKLEAAEKMTKEKNGLEAQSKKEKKDLEDNFNKEKQKLVADFEAKKKEIANLETAKADLTKKLEKSTSDLEKLKKESAANDTQKSESIKKLEKELSLNKDELNKSQTKVKSLETENTQLKADKQNYTEALEKKLKDTQSGFELKLQDYEQIKGERTSLSSKINELNESIKRLESANQTQIAEYEVLKSSYDRTTKLNQEKDDNIKKLKAKAEELTKSESSLKKSLAKAAQEKEGMEKQLQEANDRINNSESRIQQLQDELTNFGSNWKQQTERFAIIETEKNDLISKIENLEKDYKLADRKNAIMIKDLQKQLLKERKKNDDDTHSQISIPKLSTNLNESKKIPEFGSKIETSDDQIKALNEKINKLVEESENKSKTIRQYILRDNASKLMPDDRTLNKGFNMNILSSTTAMSKMDPSILTDINLKMQKLLEELTLRIQTLEAQIKQC